MFLVKFCYYFDALSILSAASLFCQNTHSFGVFLNCSLQGSRGSRKGEFHDADGLKALETEENKK
jgi:hypothetical protein